MSGRQEIRVPGQAEPISHYTDAVRAGDLLFVSGCVSVDGEGRLVGGDDVVAQARQVFANVGSILEAGGATAPDRAAFYNGALVRYLDFNDSAPSVALLLRPADPAKEATRPRLHRGLCWRTTNRGSVARARITMLHRNSLPLTLREPVPAG